MQFLKYSLKMYKILKYISDNAKIPKYVKICNKKKK